MASAPPRLAPYTADRCKNPGHFFIHDYSIGYLAGWGAHPLDIMIWGNDSDLSGPMTVEGTGTIPTEGSTTTSSTGTCGFSSATA